MPSSTVAIANTEQITVAMLDFYMIYHLPAFLESEIFTSVFFQIFPVEVKRILHELIRNDVALRVDLTGQGGLLRP